MTISIGAILLIIAATAAAAAVSAVYGYLSGYRHGREDERRHGKSLFERQGGKETRS